MMDDRLILPTISRIYEAALSPLAYEQFARQWDEYLRDGPPEDGDPVARHIGQALAIVERLDHAGETAVSPELHVDTLPGPAALIDRTGRIVAANPEWRDAHPEAAPDIWPLAADPGAQRDIRGAIQEVASAAKLPIHLLALDDLENGGHLHLSFRRLPLGPDGSEGLVCVRSMKGDWDDGLASVWRREFGLTPAETRLLRDLCGGEPFAAIAARRSKSPETLKAQSKSLYRKLSVDNREAAVMLAMRLHILAGANRAPLTRPKDTGKSDHIELASGSRVTVIRDGARSGKPLLFLHGMTLGHGLPDRMIARLTASGWRLVRIERPGYGRSDPPRNRERIVEEWVADFPSLLGELETERVTLLTHTTGVMYGCAAAAEHAELVDGIFAVSGGVPITDERMIDSYPAPLLRVVRTAKASPRALRFFLSVASNYVTLAGGEDRFIRQSYAGCPVDAAALDDEATMELVREGLKLVRDGGYRGFIGDALRIFDDWSHWLEALRCPLVYAIGTEDRFCPLDWARAAAQRHRHVSVEEIPGAAQLAQHTHDEEIVALFGEFAERLPSA